jgi:phosphonate dehydrogenase
MNMPKIVVTQRIHDEVAEALRPHGRVVANGTPEPWSAARLEEEIRDAAAVMAFMPDRVDEAFLRAAPDLRIVAGALKGYDNFDAGACTRAGVWLTVVGDLLTEPTAELAVGLMIGLGRNFLDGDRYIRSGRFEGWRPHLYGTGLKGSRVGLLGLGAVGRAVAERLAGFGTDIAYWDVSEVDPAEERRLRVRRVGLEEAVTGADFVVSALPLNPGTHHLIDRTLIARMKKGALLINPSRGSVVDEAAVADALEEGRLAGYAADVFEMEDWARPDRPHAIEPRLTAPDAPTLLTPHLGSAVRGVRLAIELEAADNIIDVLQGRPPRGAVNRPQAAGAQR